MNVSAAILVGAALIGGSVVWASEHVSRDTRCAGYLASTDGGAALFRLSMLAVSERQEIRRDPEKMAARLASGEALAKIASDANAFDVYAVSLQMAGCRLDRAGPL